MIEQIGLYTVIYVLFAVIVVFPPTEVISAGLTIERIFSFLIGEEHLDFVRYHIQRTCLTIFIHSCLPLGYFIYLELIRTTPYQIFDNIYEISILWRSSILLSIALPCGVVALIAYWYHSNWEKHPTVRTLRLYSRKWEDVAAAINTEYRRPDKFSVGLGGIRQVIVTDTWILLVSSYKLELSQQPDVQLTVVRADEHQVSHHADTMVQFIDIKVENIAKPVEPFVIRLNSLNFRDLKSKLQRPVNAARDVIVKQSLDERFVQAFQEYVDSNPKYSMPEEERQRLDLCLGCSQVTSDVKLEKNCLDSPVLQRDHEGREIPNCTHCFCRPMWCVSCMGRWFASRQDAHRPDRWLSGKSPCPTCRSTFCVLDVSLVEGVVNRN